MRQETRAEQARTEDNIAENDRRLEHRQALIEELEKIIKEQDGKKSTYPSKEKEFLIKSYYENLEKLGFKIEWEDKKRTIEAVRNDVLELIGYLKQI